MPLQNLVFGQGAHHIGQPTGLGHWKTFRRYMNNLHTTPEPLNKFNSKYHIFIACNPI
jgi:hypothetical protein